MKLKIGKRHNIEVASLEEASRVYCTLRDESGEGASTWPNGTVTGGYRVSYNGRIWLGKDSARICVYNPYAQVAA